MLQKTTDQRVLLVNLLVLLLIVASLLAGCGGPASATPTPLPPPTGRATPTPTAVSPSSATPLVVADFDSCTGTNNLGGPMGAAYNPPDSLEESYAEETSRGCVARIEYTIAGWAAFWMKLQGADLTPYSRLLFDVRADPGPGIPGRMKLELKRGGEVSVQYVAGIGAEWRTISVELVDFGSAGYSAPVSSWRGMEELVFTFEAATSGRQGVVYLDNVIFASDGTPIPTVTATTSPTPSPSSTAVPTHTPTPGQSARAFAIILDDFSPQPYQGEQVYFFNRLEGDRGAVNNSIMTWGRGQVTTTIATGNTWGGGWMSLNHPMREGLPINFSAILPAQILPPYQSQIIGLTTRIVRGTPGRTFRLEFKDHGAFRWTDEIVLNGGEQIARFDLPTLGDINELVWVLDRATGGDTVVLDSIAFTATTRIADTATAAFAWSYAQLLSNWNPETGLARDKAKDASGEFDAVQATGSLAAATALAEQLGIVSRADAIQIINRVGHTLLIETPRFHGLWPHFVRISADTGAVTIVPGTEWSSVDTVIAAIGLLAAQGGLGLDTAGTEQMLRAIDWDDLVKPDGMISMGYTYQGERIPWAWDIFGGESWLVELAYAGATGEVAAIRNPAPPTANGSGFIDELAWLFVPPPVGPDYWGTDWLEYRSAAADKQIHYYRNDYSGSCFDQLGLFGLSAAEAPDPSLVPPGESVYQSLGVGGRSDPNDGKDLMGAPVVVPHYAALIASLRPQEAIVMWDWLIKSGFFSPLNNVESLMFPAGSRCDPSAAVWNHLKGSWNLSLQTLGWGRYLAEQRGQVPILWQATMANAFLQQGYLLLSPGGSSSTRAPAPA
ncbi:MAG: DUF3131 domain-containing protein [Ardenticatenia bacterium]|nr:DUF3131 domain-containing protein [Ardenticatenia bacterium]